MVHADGSIYQTFDLFRQNGLQAFYDIWPKPTMTAWKIIACYGAFEAALQLWLPGKRVEGPISPAGNRPVYKVNEQQIQQNVFDLVSTALVTSSHTSKFVILYITKKFSICC